VFFRVNRARVSGEANVATISLRVWHERMGHANIQVLKDMVKKGVIRGVKLSDICITEICINICIYMCVININFKLYINVNIYIYIYIYIYTIYTYIHSYIKLF